VGPFVTVRWPNVSPVVGLSRKNSNVPKNRAVRPGRARRRARLVVPLAKPHGSLTGGDVARADVEWGDRVSDLVSLWIDRDHGALGPSPTHRPQKSVSHDWADEVSEPRDDAVLRRVDPHQDGAMELVRHPQAADPPTSWSGPSPSPIVATIRLLSGSIRITERSTVFDTQTDPSHHTIPPG